MMQKKKNREQIQQYREQGCASLKKVIMDKHGVN